MGALIFLGAVAASAGVFALINQADHAAAQEQNAADQLTLNEDIFEFDQNIAIQQAHQDIVEQANEAAMAMETLEQSVKEAGFYQTQFSEYAARIGVKKGEALAAHDIYAEKTVGTQRVAQAVSGAKLSTGTNLAVAEETGKNLLADRTGLASDYDQGIKEQMDQSNFYGEAVTNYQSQITKYNTLLTEIYNSNSDWLTTDNVGNYGGQYGEWLTERVRK